MSYLISLKSLFLGNMKYRHQIIADVVLFYSRHIWQVWLLTFVEGFKEKEWQWQWQWQACRMSLEESALHLPEAPLEVGRRRFVIHIIHLCRLQAAEICIVCTLYMIHPFCSVFDHFWSSPFEWAGVKCSHDRTYEWYKWSIKVWMATCNVEHGNIPSIHIGIKWFSEINWLYSNQALSFHWFLWHMAHIIGVPAT